MSLCRVAGNGNDLKKDKAMNAPVGVTGTPLRDRIEAALTAAWPEARITVEDESEGHRGHAGWREGGQTHFHVALHAPDLAGMSRLERHRAVHAAIGPDLIGQLHALRLTLSTD
jgi:BolA family transcriptional regulator, general stress-responsive regulator